MLSFIFRVVSLFHHLLGEGEPYPIPDKILYVHLQIFSHTLLS